MSLKKNYVNPYGIYVHIPFCKSKCMYCAFVSTPDFSLQKDYVSALVNEIKSQDAHGAYADTIYIGGGTPSCLYRGALNDIVSAVRNNFIISDNAEVTVECNPESVTSDFISECRNCGVNRISMGLQSSNDKILRDIGRVHNYNGYLSAAELLCKSFDNISSDIILGLPNQDKNDVSQAIATVTEFCSHASVYALTVEQGTALCDCGYSADDDFIADLYAYACDLLQSHGFMRYEVSNFALIGRQSRHNNKYWECMPYIGLGVAAHGYDGQYTRYAHGDSIAKYIENPLPQNYTITEKDRYNEYVMLRLRTEQGICLDKFSCRFGYSFVERNNSLLERLNNAGYIVIDDGYVKIAPQYMFVMNGIIEELMLD